MKFDPISRRMFLRGASGALLSIPTLVSLLPKSIRAQGAHIAPRFIFISCQNGGQQIQSWYPSEFPTTPFEVHPSDDNGDPHIGKIGSINVDNTMGISPIFDKKFNSFTNKMNFLHGLDQRFTPFGNHRGAPLLGNVGSAHNSVSLCNSIPTIDQLMAYTDGFYPGDGTGYVRSLVINPSSNSRNTSFNWSNPYKKSGNIEHIPSMDDPSQIFKQLFKYTSALNDDSAKPIVDDVLDNFKRVFNGSKISSIEKPIIEEYIDRLAELDKKINIDVIPSTPSCKNLVSPDAFKDDETKRVQAINDLMILAFMCQRTRVATIHFNRANGIPEGGGESVGSWHWSSHNASRNNALAIKTLEDIYKWVADTSLLDLMKKMDVINESNGMTMLDNSLIHFATSSGGDAHSSTNLPTLLVGSAGGFFETGKFVNYRDENEVGILHNQYLANIMYSMGLKKNDWNMSRLGLADKSIGEGDLGYGWYKHIDINGINNKNTKTKYIKSEKYVISPLNGIVKDSKKSIFGT